MHSRDKNGAGPSCESEPFVSVVTPFYNAADYLEECIRSVLDQTYCNFEYVLLDNCSTDRSYEIARKHADADARIRLIRATEFLGQVPNYNRAIDAVSKESRYFKIVQADDMIDPDCLRQLVRVAESDDRIGMVCSLYMKGESILGVGVPWQARNLEGREVCRMQLIERKFFFGAPTVPLFRTSLLQTRKPFYREDRYHEDTEACYEILQDARFGYVPAVLAWQRIDNEGVTKSRSRFDLRDLDFYIIVERFGQVFLTETELATVRKKARTQYYDRLAKALLRFRRKDYWDYHKVGLTTVGQEIEWLLVMYRAIVLLVRFAVNPSRWILALQRSRPSFQR